MPAGHWEAIAEILRLKVPGEPISFSLLPSEKISLETFLRGSQKRVKVIPTGLFCAVWKEDVSGIPGDRTEIF